MNLKEYVKITKPNEVERLNQKIQELYQKQRTLINHIKIRDKKIDRLEWVIVILAGIILGKLIAFLLF